MSTKIIFGWLKQYVSGLTEKTGNCAILDTGLNNVQEYDKPEPEPVYRGLGGWPVNSPANDAMWADIERQKEIMKRENR